MDTVRSSSTGTRREAGRCPSSIHRRAIADEAAPDFAVTADVTEIGFPELIRRLAALGLPPIDLVVGIGRGGVVPAALAAQRLACDLRVLPVRFRDDSHQPERAEPLVTPPSFDVTGKRVLLVDDVARTGSTLRAAAGALDGAAAVHTLVVAGCADYALFQVDSCIAWPWQAETA
jgi:adenine/guanine phosphoribosyltransferase-like PRPP-binding protein